MLDAFASDVSGRRSALIARAALVLALLAAGFGAVRLLTLITFGPTLPQVMPVNLSGAPGETPASAQSVANWHLFGNAVGPIDLAALARVAPATALKLILRGTLNEHAPEGGVAIISDENGVDRAYRVGDALPGDARLEGIYSGRVLLSRAGVSESLSLPRATVAEDAPNPSSPAPMPGNGNRPVNLPGNAASASFVTPMIAPGGPSMDSLRASVIGADPAELARQVQIYPVSENGRMVGVRLAAGRDSDLLSRAGLHPNDIVTQVNGIPLDGPQRQIELMTNLKDARQLQLTVRRDGKEIQLSIGL